MPSIGTRLNGTQLLLIRDADLHAPEPLGRQQLLCGGGRVLWIGSDPLELPRALRDSCRVLELGGATLIPGLVDGHVHATGGGGESGFASRVPAVPLSRFTSAGVTSVVGLLGTDDTARGSRELLAAVYALREQGLNAWGWCGGYHLPPATLTGSVRGDLVFVEALIGVGEVAISDHRSSQPTLDELLRLASECHVAGLMTGKAGLLHLHLGDGPRGLALVREALASSELPARVFHPTHVNRRKALFDEALALAKQGSAIDLTAFPVAEGEDAWSAGEAIARYLASDAPRAHLTVSSDAGGCLPCFDADGRVTHAEVGSAGGLLAALAEARARGVALSDALPAFTRNPAALLRLPGKGRIAVGADADLCALDDQGRASTVVIGGTIHLRDGRPTVLGPFEARP